MTRILPPFVKKAVKVQMLRPLSFCLVKQAWCRFHIPGYCLEEYKPYACEFSHFSKLSFKEKEDRKNDQSTQSSNQ